MRASKKIMCRLSSLFLVLTFVGVAYAIPQPGSVAIRTFSADGHPVPFTDVRMRLLEGDYPQDTICTTTNGAATRWVSVNTGLYEIAGLDENGAPMPDPLVLFVPSGAHDIIAYLIVPNVCNTDLDGSGDVGLGDLILVLSAWGEFCHFGCAEDITGDGITDFADLLAVISTWGTCGNES